jgi:DnaJ-class molecular chaperone
MSKEHFIAAHEALTEEKMEPRECAECCGNGQTIGQNSGEDIICPKCKGTGWIEMDANARALIARIDARDAPVHAAAKEVLAARSTS